MTEEPYRWLEAIGNRREYVLNQIKGGSPVLGVSLAHGILLLGAGAGHGKVFEIYDRQALAGLGHPADLERIRQGLIDAAHLEGFSRAPEDVSLRRLVAFGLGPQLKTSFEQLFAPPFLVRLLLAEVGDSPARDHLLKVDFDGTFATATNRAAVVSGTPQPEEDSRLEVWLCSRIPPDAPTPVALAWLECAWLHLARGTPLPVTSTPPDRPDLAPLVPEVALLQRTALTAARYLPIPARA